MSDEWYYSRDQQQYGPFLFDDLVEMAQKDVITKSDLLWKEDMDEWRPAETIVGLFDEPAAPAATGYVSPFAKQSAATGTPMPPVQSTDATGNQYAAPATTQTAAPAKKSGGIDWWYLGGGCLIHIVLVIIGIVIAIIEIVLDV